MTSVRSTEIEFSNPVGDLRNNVRRGLVGEFVFGGSADLSKRNLADRSAPDATFSGTAPTWGENHARFVTGQVMDTGIRAGMRSLTQIIIARGVSGFGEIVTAFSPFAGFIYNTGDASYRYNNSLNANPPGAASVSPSNVGDPFHCVIGFGKEFAPSLVSAGVGGAFNSDVGDDAGIARNPASTFKFGADNGVGSVTFDIAYWAVYDVILTLRERTAAYQALRAYYETLNVG